MLAISFVNNFILERCFPSGYLTLDVGHFFRLLLICIFQLKCREKRDEITYNVGYLSFIDEYYYAEVKIQMCEF